jgi:hypothetical protein
VSKSKERIKTDKKAEKKRWPIMAKNNQNCTHPVPKNKYGIVARHSISNQPISSADAKKVLSGPIAAIESDYRAEISKPADFRKCKKEFNPLSILLKCCPAPLSEKTKILI